jgi:hypothetical protein
LLYLLTFFQLSFIQIPEEPKNLAGAILHVSGKRIDADPSPALLLERFGIRKEGAVS